MKPEIIKNGLAAALKNEPTIVKSVCEIQPTAKVKDAMITLDFPPIGASCTQRSQLSEETHQFFLQMKLLNKEGLNIHSEQV